MIPQLTLPKLFSKFRIFFQKFPSCDTFQVLDNQGWGKFGRGGDKKMDMIHVPGFEFVYMKSFRVCNLMDDFAHIGFDFRGNDFSSVFDRPDDVIINVVNRCS